MDARLRQKEVIHSIGSSIWANFLGLGVLLAEDNALGRPRFGCVSLATGLRIYGRM